MRNLTARQALGWAALLFALASAGACTEKPQAARRIDPVEAMGQLRNGFAVLVDVREESELTSGWAQGAMKFPFSAFEAKGAAWDDFVKRLPKDKLIMAYCASGRRAELVARELKRQGFEVANLGPFSGWMSSGLPVEGGPAPRAEGKKK
ncbi:MAG: hypothetical protein IT285_12560 [Bdellovibrionales bacterium]|nr:hypothetical protein [Bdellovibrionales bacterium]